MLKSRPPGEGADMKAVLDPHVLISDRLSARAPPAQIIQAIETGQTEPVFCEPSQEATLNLIHHKSIPPAGRPHGRAGIRGAKQRAVKADVPCSIRRNRPLI